MATANWSNSMEVNVALPIYTTVCLACSAPLSELKYNILHVTRNIKGKKIPTVLFILQFTNKVSIPHFHRKILKLQLRGFLFLNLDTCKQV